MKDDKTTVLSNFDPNNIGLSSNQIFGLPFSVEQSELVLLPVPWDVTVSYSGGTCHAPAAIKEASYQVDLFDPLYKDLWQRGIAMQDISQDWLNISRKQRVSAEKYIAFLEQGGVVESDSEMSSILANINQTCFELKEWVKGQAKALLFAKKLVGMVGGDHSTPLGLIEAVGESFGDFGILQIDAHCDLRQAYEGFEYSHASIMYNALKISEVKKIVQVGIRDLCDAERDYIYGSNGRVKTYFDGDLKRSLFKGECWDSLAREMVEQLPEQVYVSFDIDGLDPKLCPNTGTPVPGGLEFAEVSYLIDLLVESKRKIVGFDLNEVSPAQGSEWDANVGARVLYRLCNAMMKSRG